AMAQTPQRWVAHETQAQATLPLPRDNDRASAARLSCAAQQWTLTIEAAETGGDGDYPAEMRIDGKAFPLEANAQANAVSLRIPRAALEPLKAGLRWEIDLSDRLEETVGDMTIPLRGSRIAITAMENT